MLDTMQRVLQVAYKDALPVKISKRDGRSPRPVLFRSSEFRLLGRTAVVHSVSPCITDWNRKKVYFLGFLFSCPAKG